jgi:hypothetical protein
VKTHLVTWPEVSGSFGGRPATRSSS